MRLKRHLQTHTGWEIIEDMFQKDEIINKGSLFLIGNGYLGYRGTLTEWRRDEYVACIVSDTYDEAQKGWMELCNAPNGLYLCIEVEGEEVSLFRGEVEEYERILDLKRGLFSRQMTWQGEKKKRVLLRDERFASYENLHLLPLTMSIRGEDEMMIKIITGIDGNVWDLHGTHLPHLTKRINDDLLIIEGETSQEKLKIVVVEGINILSPSPKRVEIREDERGIYREYSFTLKAKEEILLEKVMVVYSENDTPHPLREACRGAREALVRGYEDLLREHSNRWEEKWDISDIEIIGDLEAQTALRYNLYQNIITTPAHSQNLPIGARGLSCQAYQGAAFWDQEIFNLPMIIFNNPEVARNILLYRYKTLDGARKKAKDLGYRGAFYAWMSGKTGEELCPSYFFKNLFTGRWIHNHFNEWQIHISPDIIYALDQYYQATGDREFIQEYGSEMAFEVARFLFSHAYFKKEKNQYEIIRVMGPDEYHENVDNNAYTNYMTSFSLKRAVEYYQTLKQENEDLLLEIMDRIHLREEEVRGWQEMANLLYLPSPDPLNHLIEQFDGYFQLEDCKPEDLEERLLHPQEYWGWPDGIAVETQVNKQADIVQLLALFDFPLEVVEANYKYYKERTQHGSSLSPSVHSQVAARIGDLEEALKYFYQSTTIDLYNEGEGIVGGTFIGGIHTAACGGAWQMIVFGFAGMKIDGETLTFQPVIPSLWERISFNLFFRGDFLFLDFFQDRVIIRASEENSSSLALAIYDDFLTIYPREEKKLYYK